MIMEGILPRNSAIGNDDAVIATNDDASSCKRCAVNLGYWKDPYIQYFVKSSDRKAPEINRGYFTRTFAIQLLVEKFIDITKGRCQVVNIGAGFDTLFWRLKYNKKFVKAFVELDFPTVTSKKCLYIQRSKPILQEISHEDHDIKLNRSNLHAYNYKLIGVDLRSLKDVEEKLKEADIDFTIPTVFIAECVLVYMNIAKSSQLLHLITDKFKSAFFINYEMVNLHDRFGEVMLNNLRGRGCDLQGAEVCKDLNAQQTRFTKEGWAGAESSDMLAIWSRLPPDEISRITQIEMLDEQELLIQLFSHYCITLAWNDSRWAEVQL